MLTPSIVRDERLWEAGQDGLEILDAVRVGVRSGLLPFSQTRMTSNYNRDALEAYRNGELDLALFYANNSLRLDSTQPEMHRLRSTFASEATDQAWERSLHERILMREMEFVPPNSLDPEPTPNFDIDTSRRLIEDEPAHVWRHEVQDREVEGDAQGHLFAAGAVLSGDRARLSVHVDRVVRRVPAQ